MKQQHSQSLSFFRCHIKSGRKIDGCPRRSARRSDLENRSRLRLSSAATVKCLVSRAPSSPTMMRRRRVWGRRGWLRAARRHHSMARGGGACVISVPGDSRRWLRGRWAGGRDNPGPSRPPRRHRPWHSAVSPRQCRPAGTAQLY